MLIRVVAATIAGGVVFMLVGFLIFGLALAETMKAWTVNYPGLMKEPPNFIALFLSNLAWAFDTWFLNLFPREKPFTHNGGATPH